MRKIYSLPKLDKKEVKSLKEIIYRPNGKFGVFYDNIDKAKKICNILLSINEGVNTKTIMKQYEVNHTTIFNYINRYKKNPRFMLVPTKKPVSKLEMYEFEIAKLLKERKITKYTEAYEIVKKEFNIKVSYQRFYIFLKQHDFILDKTKKKITQKNTLGVVQRRKKAAETNINKHQSYLDTIADKIEEYVYRITSSYDYEENYDLNKVAEMVKEKFELNEPLKEIEDWIKKNTSIG